jgi:hypothetical protein
MILVIIIHEIRGVDGLQNHQIDELMEVGLPLLHQQVVYELRDIQLQ